MFVETLTHLLVYFLVHYLFFFFNTYALDQNLDYCMTIGFVQVRVNIGTE